jgi:MSHA pilin protein MshC
MRGFTLVELTTVLVLVGVLSVVATSRLVPASSFEANDLSRALLAAGHLAQRTALARTDGTTTMEVAASAATVRITVGFDDGTATRLLSDVELDARGLGLAVSAGGLAGAIGGGDVLRIEYAGNGDLAAVALNSATGTVASGVALAWQGAGPFELCVAATGYAHEGSCT